MSCPPSADAFVEPDTVAEVWSELEARARPLGDARATLATLGVAAPEEELAGEHALLILEDLDVFPILNLADDPDAPTCTRDLPLRVWVKRRLRERGVALVFPLRSLARDAVVNLYLHYVGSGRRDFLRGAGLTDGGAPLVLGQARGSDVEIVEGLEDWLAARGHGRSRAVGTPLPGMRADVEAWLTR